MEVNILLDDSFSNFTILQHVLVHKSSLSGHRTLESGYPFLATFLGWAKVKID